MNEVLSVPLKRGSDLDLVGPLTRWINVNYKTTQDNIEAISDVSKLSKMRQKVIKLADRNEEGLSATTSYYYQISALEEKINVDELHLSFKWKDAFEGGRKSALSKGKASLSLSSISYEKHCIMFNIAALNSWVAANQDLNSCEGLQKALKCFQIGAGIFKYLEDNVKDTIEKNPTLDMKTETLGVLGELMLAQAQEMVVCKAISENMKDGVVAKLCSQCDALYLNLKQAMSSSSNKVFVPTNWHIMVSQKQMFYSGLAQYHQSSICHDKKAIGEEIARLRCAKNLLANIAVSSSTYLRDVKEWRNKIQVALENTSKENDCIYSEKIPEEKHLLQIERVAVAKPSLISSTLRKPSTPCLFDMLLPITVFKSLAEFDIKMNALKTNELDKLNEASKLLNQTLSSLNLPAALEEVSGNELPISLKDKSSSVQLAGGINAISIAYDGFHDLANKTISIIDECQYLLAEKKDAEAKLKLKFGDDWSRVSFDQIDKHLETIEKYRTCVNNASLTDDLVNKKIETHKVFLDMLSKGSVYLEATVPSAQITAVPHLPIAKILCGQMKEVDVLKSERKGLASEINSIRKKSEIKIHVKSVFLNIFSKDGVISNENAISKQILEKEFGNIQRKINDNIEHQNELISKIRINQAELFKDNVFGSAAREEMCKQLAVAHDAYFEIKGNIDEGQSFYCDLLQSLTTFHNTLKDFCIGLDLEKEGMIEELSSPIFYDAN